jgi:hypothetical protein
MSPSLIVHARSPCSTWVCPWRRTRIRSSSGSPRAMSRVVRRHALGSAVTRLIATDPSSWATRRARNGRGVGVLMLIGKSVSAVSARHCSSRRGSGTLIVSKTTATGPGRYRGAVRA